MSEAGIVGGSSAQAAENPQGAALHRRILDVLSNDTPALDDAGFADLALEVFRFQWGANALYRRWCDALGWRAEAVQALQDWTAIPALPVEAFKWGVVRTEGVGMPDPEAVFRTSGTTGQVQGEHHLHTADLYRASSIAGFRAAFGEPGPRGADLIALLPGYLERPDSSLVHMVRDLRAAGWKAPESSVDDGFFLDNVAGLFEAVDCALDAGRHPVLMGVTWALVDAAEAWHRSGRRPMSDRVTLIETGGMKGRRREWVREEVHAHLMAHFGCSQVGGEYGMTELLSQAWSLGQGHYTTPPWMRVRLRRTDDPLTPQGDGATGGLDVVDLANLGSCAFLSTQDLARPKGGDPHREFEVLGRFDHAEVRGCNLMVQ